MKKENASLDFRLQKIDEKNPFFLGKIKHDELMSEKHEKCC